MKDTTRYPALRRYVSETPWALHPSTLLMLREIVGRRIEGTRLTAEEVAEITAAAPQRTAATPGSGSVAVLPLWGILSPHQVSDVSSGPTTALDTWGAKFDELVADASIGTIILDVDSPGGSVDLVPETAAKVRAANARKDIIAVANTRIASAAYWIAAQAGQLFVTPSGAVGSIGVYAAHEDVSRQLDSDGITVTLVSAGDHKVEGNPFEPLSDEARATIQANINAYYAMFKADVAKGRGVTVGVVNGSFGQGRMVLAADAVNAGMADGIATLEQTIDAVLGGKPATRRARAADLEPAVAAVATTTRSGQGQLGATASSSGSQIVVEIVADTSDLERGLLRAGGVERLLLAAKAAEELGVSPADLAPSLISIEQPNDQAARVASRERLRARVAAHKNSGDDPVAGGGAPGVETPQRKETMVKTIAELTARREEITARMKELDQKAGDGGFEDAAEEAEFEQLDKEITDLDASLEKIDGRRSRLATIFDRTPKSSRIAATPSAIEAGMKIHSNVDSKRTPDNLHSLGDYRVLAGSIEELHTIQADGARRIMEGIKLVVPGGASEDIGHEHVDRVLESDPGAEFAKRVILCADPNYEKAFLKAAARGRDALSADDDRLIRAAITESGIGSETPVPITIDPTVTLTSNGAANPWRAIANVKTITGLTYRGLTSGGMTMAYESAETNQVADQTPTLGGTDVNVLRMDGWVAFSMEIDQDWPMLRAELAKEFVDAKDVLEAAKFATGSGTNEPQGVITGVTANTASVVKTATTAVLAVTDPDLASNALPPRFDANAVWAGNKAIWAKIEQLYMAQGNADPFSFASVGIPNFGAGDVQRIFKGFPIRSASAMDSAPTTSGQNVLVLGDFNQYIIVDRIGMNVELVPVVMGANNRPIGQRGLYTYLRNNAFVKTAAAFRVLQIK